MPQRIFSRARILVIDDEPTNVELLKRVLERAGFSRVVTTCDPRQAKDLYIEFRPDLVLLDLHMPHLDGFAVMQQFNQIAEATYLPILIVTGDLSAQAKRDALSRGAGASGGAGGTREQVLADKLWERLSASVYVMLHQTRLGDVVKNELAPCPAVPAFVAVVDEEHAAT